MTHDIQVHHVGLGGSAPRFGGAVDLHSCPPVNFGGDPVRWTKGPNLYLQRGPSSDDTSGARPVAAPGLAHLCLQARDGDAARGALETGATSFLSEPIALGTGFHYAYGHDRDGRLLELESAPFLPSTPRSWFGHVAYVSRDIERLAAFYSAVLGASLTIGGRYRDNPLIDAVAGLQQVDVEVRWVRTRDFALEFWRYHAPRIEIDRPERWYSHLGLETDDLEAGRERILAAGGGAMGAPTAGRDGRAAWLRDPDGNRIHLIEVASPVFGVAALRDRDALARAAAARAGTGATA